MKKFLMYVTFFWCLSFSEGITVDELSQQVAGQFVEAFDRIIEIEKKSAIEIKELKSKDLNNTKEIKFLMQQVEELKKNNTQETETRIRNTEQIKLLKEQVEELRKITAPETCAQLVKQGVTRGEDIYLDSDGVNHGKKHLLMLTIFSSPCSFRIGFCSLNFYRNFPNIFLAENLTLIEFFCHHVQPTEFYKKCS